MTLAAKLTPESLAAAALSLVGVPYRLHGRDPERGLDCIGVFAAALDRAGGAIRLPNGYAMRRLLLPETQGFASELGFVQASGAAQMGDVVFLAPGPCQFHLAIMLDAASAVHAHAGLRRVVRSPLPAEWPVIEHWRLFNQTQGN